MNGDAHIPRTAFVEEFGIYLIEARTGGFCRFDERNLTNHPHWHDCYEICVVLSGEGAFIHGGELYRLAEGDVFVADPRVRHEISSYVTRDLRLYFFSLTVRDRTVSSEAGREETTLRQFLTGHRIRRDKCFHLVDYVRFMTGYHHWRHEHNFWSRRTLQGFMFECLEALALAPAPETPPPPPLESSVVETAISYIVGNLRRKLTLSDLAAHCCTCERNLQLLFRTHLGTTPVRFINEKKAALAAGYLLQGYRVADAGAVVGIADPAQFSRFFQQYFRCSPKRYQQQYLPRGMKFSARHEPEPFQTAFHLQEE